MANKNPWLGLASYEEPKNDNSDYKFCGRDEETMEVVRLIDNNLFITLYGSSGIGKTSLLKSGVIPILRKRDYYPVYIRLSQEPTELSYAEAIIKRLIDSGLREERSVKLEHSDGNDRLYLWNYFATTRWINADGNEVYPVMILDQFEEVFRDADKKKAELLLKQMYLLLNDELEMPDEEGYSADTNYRFVASIREDFLFVLEDSIDAFGLDLYKSNRYRLRAMKPENARQVVLIPGRDCIEESEKDNVADRILKLAKKPQSDDIDTLLLSLVCAGTLDKKIGDKITLGDLSIWKDNPMQVYYQDAVKTLNANQIRYIQQNLIREDGSRRRVDVKDLKEALGDIDFRKLVEGKNRLFSIGDKGQAELLHDKLAMAVYEERKAFEERERKLKLKRRIVFIGLFIMLILVVFLTQYRKRMKQAEIILQINNDIISKNERLLSDSILMAKQLEDIKSRDALIMQQQDSINQTNDGLAALNYQLFVERDHIKQANKSILENQSRYVAEKVNNLAKKDSYLARLLALEVLPKNINRQEDKSYTVEAEIALREAVGYNSAILKGHTASVRYANFSPDGRYIVSASNDKTLRVWDANNGSVVKILKGHNSIVNYASFSPDGKYIVSASNDKTLRIWDAETGLVARVFEDNTSFIVYALFSPKGKYVASISNDKVLKVWDIKTGVLVKIIEDVFGSNGSNLRGIQAKPENTVSDGGYLQAFENKSGISKISENNKYDYSYSNYNSIINDNKKKQIGYHTKEEDAFYGKDNNSSVTVLSPDGEYIVSASNDKTLMMWSAETDTIIRTFKGHTDIVNSIRFSPDCKQMVSASNDKTIIVWDVETGMIIKVLTGHTQGVMNACFSPDGKYIASASKDNTIRLWDTKTLSIKKIMEGHMGCVNYVSFSPDGKYIVSASNDKTLMLWDCEIDNHVQIIADSCYIKKTLSNSWKNLVVASSEDKTILFNSENGNIFKVLEGNNNIKRKEKTSPKNITNISYNNKFTETLNSNKELKQAYDKTINDIISVSSGLSNKTDEITDKDILAKCDFYSASFSPNGKHVVSVSNDNTLTLWDVDSERVIKTLIGHTAKINNVLFGCDGKTILSASDDKTIRVWNSEDEVMVIEGHSDGVCSAIFSNDCKLIASASKDNTVKIWDAKTYQLKQVLEGHTDYVKFASFSPDTKYVVSVSADKTIRVWEINTGMCVKVFKGYNSIIDYVSFTSDGKHIVTISKDGAILQWDFPPLQELIDSTRERFKNRPLTDEEKKMYYLE